MILSVYIISSLSGLCLLSWSKILKKFDDALIGGFLIAISRFGREIGGEDAQFVDFSERKFIFASQDKLIFVIEITSAKEVEIGRSLLRQIMVEFFRYYGDAKEIVAEADISILWPFRNRIEQLISSQVVELERLLNEIYKNSNASGVILLNLNGAVFTVMPRQIEDISDTFIASIKTVLDAHESITNDDSPFEIVINGLHQNLYIRRVVGDNFLLIHGSKEMAEGYLRVIINRYLDELASILLTFSHIKPRAVGTEATIQKFLEWSSKHFLLSQLRFQEYEAHLDTIMKTKQGLYEFDCVLKSISEIAFIRIYRKFGQSDIKFVENFVNDVNLMCRQLDPSPVLFAIISKDDFSKRAREFAQKALIRYKDMYFKVFLCKQTNGGFHIIKRLKGQKEKEEFFEENSYRNRRA